MLRSNVTKSLAAAAVGFFATYAATAQEVKNLPADATAHFIYFPTGGYKLDAKDEEQIRDVAGMIQSHPDFVATILGKTDFRWLCRDSTSAYHNGAPTPYSRLSCMTTKCQRTGYNVLDRRAAAIHINCRSNAQRRRTGWLRLS